MIQRRNKKQYSFKPRNSKLKIENSDLDLKNISNKENNNCLKENQNNKINKFINYKQKKSSFNSNSKTKENSKRSLSINTNENKQEINQNIPKLKFVKKQSFILFQPKKKINLNLNSSNSQRKNSINSENLTILSTQSSKQLKTVHLKKDFYIPTVSTCLIYKNKNDNDNTKNNFRPLIYGKGSLKFIERRKNKLMNKYKKESFNNISDNHCFNHKKILDDLNLISNELNDKKIENKIKIKKNSSQRIILKNNNFI